jgi:hypothetical protein
MRSREAVGGEACPDPELLAAFVDGGLQSVERDRIERHAASCSGCAQILAVVAASEPLAAQHGRTAGRSGWRALRWAVPVATAVVVGGVWFITPGQDSRSVAPLSPADEVSETATSLPPASDTASRLDSMQAKTGVVPQLTDGVRGIDHVKPEKQAEPAELARLRASTAASGARVGEQERRDSTATANFEAPGPRENGRTTAFAETREAAKGAPVAPASRARKEEGSQGADINQQVLTTNPDIVWRNRGPIVERSTNGGGTWTVEYTAPQPLAGGSAAAPDVVWFFARGGLILRGVQGKWTQSSAPAGVTVASLRATTATRATIRAVDGRVLDTSDGGLGWTAR